MASSARAIFLTRHAIERYEQRIRPGVTIEEARADLERLAAQGTLTVDPPPWIGQSNWTAAVRYLLVGDVVLPLGRADGRLIALTCIPRRKDQPARAGNVPRSALATEDPSIRVSPRSVAKVALCTHRRLPATADTSGSVTPVSRLPASRGKPS